MTTRYPGKVKEESSKDYNSVQSHLDRQRVEVNGQSEDAFSESQNQTKADLEAMYVLQGLANISITQRDLNQVLVAIVDAAIAISGADFGNIQIFDPVTSNLNIAASRGFPDWWLNYWNSVSEGQGVCGTALARGERVIVEDVTKNPIFIGKPALEIQLRAGVRAVQSTPLISRSGNPLGMFSTHYKVPGRPDERRLRLLDMLGRQAADTIERAQSEEVLCLAKLNLEKANQAKDRFFASLSHELRTPLTPILMATQMLERVEDLPASVREYVRVIKHNVALEARLIDDVLDFNKIAHGKIDLSCSNVDIHEVIRQAIETCKFKIQEKGQQLSLQLEAKSQFVWGDWPRLQQVLWNLISNASKFTPSEGHITIRTKDAGDKIEIQVIDDGRGIDPHDLPKLFNAFEQGQTSTVKELGGLGLGLAISRGLTTRHGGSLEANSDGPGKGSKFILTIPIKEQVIKEAQGQELPVQKVPRKILLVEDEAVTGLMLKNLLESDGHTVHYAPNVASALGAARQKKFDILLCDIALPDGSGLEIVSFLRKQDSILKAIAISGFGMEDDVEKCKRAGFDVHLTKPVDIEVVEKLIGTI